MFIIALIVLYKLPYYEELEVNRWLVFLFGTHQGLLELLTILTYLDGDEKWYNFLYFIAIELVINLISIPSLIHKTKRSDRIARLTLDINKLTNSINNNLNKQKV